MPLLDSLCIILPFASNPVIAGMQALVFVGAVEVCGDFHAMGDQDVSTVSVHSPCTDSTGCEKVSQCRPAMQSRSCSALRLSVTVHEKKSAGDGLTTCRSPPLTTC